MNIVKVFFKELGCVQMALLRLVLSLLGNGGLARRIRARVYSAFSGRRFHVGRNVAIASDVYIHTLNEQIYLDDECQIFVGVHLDAGSGIHIGKRAAIGFRCLFITSEHPVDTDFKKIRPAYPGGPIKLEDDVWLGASVIVLPGVTIGKGSVIGAGSLVTKSIPPNSLALGSPAKVIRSINQDEDRSALV
ncbi:MAG: acyltransferase [Vampirovibrionales bacterium]|nr:acyltransferase [Vampirovibrionales bacterium]